MASIYYIKKKKLWVTSYLVQGKRKYLYSQSRREAEALMPSASPGTPLFSSTIARIESGFQVRESTLARYLLELRDLRKCLVDDYITTQSIESAVERIRKYPAAKAARVFKRLRSVVLFAGVTVPGHLKVTHKHQRGRVLTQDEVQGILLRTQQEYPLYYPLLCFLLDTGCRIGEALALNWEDYDGCSVVITKTYQEANKGPKMHQTKTLAGNRRIVLSEPLNAVLGPLRGCNGIPVFQSARGFRMRVVNLWNRWWRWVGLGYRIHDLRHTNATFLLSRLPARQVSARLGHQHAGITHKLYDHYVLENLPVQHTLLHRSA